MGLIAVADSDGHIGGRGGGGGGGGHPDPEIRGGSLNKFFSTYQASVWSKNNGEVPPTGPLH